MSTTSELRAKYGVDNKDTGTILVYFKQYEPGGTVYICGAVKGRDKWHNTDGKQYKWFQLIEEINRENVGDKSLYEMSEVVPIWKDPDVWGDEGEVSE